MLEFTVSQLVSGLIYICLFLLVGYIARELVPAFRKLYLPASLIAGVLAVGLGSQGVDLIPVPDSAAELVTPLVDLMFCSLLWGVTINGRKLKSLGDYFFPTFSIGWVQVGIGCAVGFALWKIQPTLPKGWGMMLPIGFASGHGSVPPFNGLYEQNGVEGAGEIGMVLATIGLIVAIVLGTVFVNFGIRKGWAKYASSATRQYEARGALPEAQREPIGFSRINPGAANNLLFQFAIVCLVFFAGSQLMQLLSKLIPILAILPTFTHGVVGALILWPIFRAVKLDKYVDPATTRSITGFLVDVVIVAALASMNLRAVTSAWLPIIIIAVVGTLVTAAYVYYFCYRMCADDWFERATFLFGQSTGMSASGLALLRMLDPERKSATWEDQAVLASIVAPIGMVTWTSVLLVGLRSPGMDAVIGCAIFVVATGLGMILFGKNAKKRQQAGAGVISQ